LEEEKHTWEEMTKLNSNPLKSHDYSTLSTLNPSLLRTNEVEMLKRIDDRPQISTISRSLLDSQSNLEYQIDDITDNLHKMEQFGQVAEAFGDLVLAKVAGELAERQEATRRAAGTKDIPLQEVLRSISHLER